MSTNSPSSFFLPLLIIFDQSLSNTTEEQALIALQLPTDLPRPEWHWVTTDEPLTIDQVRDLTQELAFASPNEVTRIYIIRQLESASIPAQQALLKLLEEPPAQTQLILLTTQLTSILPTIQSRSRLVTVQTQTPDQPVESEFSAIGQELATLSVGRCLEIAEKYGERQAAKQLVQKLLQWLRQQPPTAQTTQQQQQLLTAFRQLQTNGNVRLIIENCLLNASKHS